MTGRMKYLVVARHGSHTVGYLNDRGRAQAEQLAEVLKEVCSGKIIILSSRTPRAFDSAQVISEILKVSIVKDDSLSEWSFDWGKIFELINTYVDQYDNIILVTHMSQAEIFPVYFCKKALDMLIAQEEAETGKAWLIDCEAKTCRIIP